VADDPKKLRRKAQKQVRDGNYGRAIDLYEQLVELDPKTARHRLKLADLYARQDRTEEAVEAYRAVGKIHADDEIYQKAVAVYKQALRLESEDPQLQVRLAEAYVGLGRLKDAARTYRRAGEMFEERGERERQVEMLERLCDLDHEDVGIRIQLAETYAKVGRKQDALETFRQAAEALEEEGRFDEFIQVGERILYFDPDDRTMRKRLVRRYLGRGDDKRALKHLQICYNADSSDVQTLEMLVEAFDRLDRTSKTALVLRQLAKRRMELGDHDAAEKAWRQLLETDPENSAARQALDQLGADVSNKSSESTPSAGSARGSPPPPEASARQRNSSHNQAGDDGDDEHRRDSLEDIEFLDEPDDNQQTSSSAGGDVETASMDRGEQEASEVEELDPSALEPIEEATSEPTGDASGAPPPTPGDTEGSREDVANTGLDGDTDVDEQPVADLTDQVEPVESDEGAVEAAKGESGDSHSIPTERQMESVADQELAETLSEVDVFLKYGLYDKVRELLTGIGHENARELPVLERRRQMYEHTDEPEAEAGVLIEMARQTESRQDALRYLSAARERTSRTERIDDVADELGLSTDRVVDDQRALPEFESGDMPEAPDADGDRAAASLEDGEVSEADETAEVDRIDSETLDEASKPEAVANSDDGPTFEHPPSDAAVPPADDMPETEPPERPPISDSADAGGAGDGPDEGSADPAADTEGAVEEVSDMAFDADALESFDGIETVDEVEEDDFNAGLQSEPDASEENADNLFHEIDEQFADELFDSLVMEEEGGEQDVNLGGDDTTGDLAEVDFYIQQGLYDEAEEALDEFEAANPDHEGIDKRRYQIKTARQGAFVRDNPTGAASLSGKFDASLAADESGENDVESHAAQRASSAGDTDQPDAVNTNIEVGEAYLDMGMYDEAIEEFREAADDPEVAPHARYRIAVCEAERGNPDEAADTLQSLLRATDISDELRTAARDKLDEIDAPRAE